MIFIFDLNIFSIFLKVFELYFSKYFALYGGKFLVRGGKHETKEGTNFSRNVVVEFDSYNLALSAYSSSEYKKALEILDGGAQRMYAVVEGYE